MKLGGKLVYKTVRMCDSVNNLLLKKVSFAYSS